MLLQLIAVVAALVTVAIIGLMIARQCALLNEVAAAKQATERSEARHHELIERLNAVIWEAEADTLRIRFVSRRAEAVFGYSVAEWAGSSQIWRKLIHPDDYERVLQQRQRAVNADEAYDIEYRCVTRTGETLHVREVLQIDHSLAPPVLRGVLFDVTGEHRTYSALEETERKLRAFVNNAPEPLIVSDARSRIVEVNGRLCDMLGYTRHELLALSVSDLDPENLPIMTGMRETTFRRKDGETIPIQLSTSVWEDAEPQMFITLARDITQKNALERQLRQAQRMEALGRLAGGVAHDFNNLLTTIRGHADLLREDLPDDIGITEIDGINDAAQRAGALTRQLLAFSRQQVMQLQVLDINAVVTQMHNLLRRLIGDNITLVTRLDANAAAIEADRAQLEQVLMNLVLNARDAMPKGGELTIRTANAVLTEIDAERSPFVKPGHYVLLLVSDEGVGMDAATVAHVFDPFFTTKKPGTGGGLGLATAYGIVKQLGGYIWCDSAIGRGSTFRVYLPPAGAKPFAPDTFSAKVG